MPKKKAMMYRCAEHGWFPVEVCPECGGTLEGMPKRRNSSYYLASLDHPVPSVTTIIGVINKPALSAWFAKEGARIAFEDPSQTVEDVKRKMEENRVVAADRGSDIHSLISNQRFDRAMVPAHLHGYLDAYDQWVKAFPHEIIEREKIVFTEDYGGKFDALIKDTAGKYWMVDYKTNRSGLFAETGLQLSAYKHATMIEREKDDCVPFEIDVQGLMGVNLQEDGTFATKQYRDDYEIFQAALRLWRWSQGLQE